MAFIWPRARRIDRIVTRERAAASAGGDERGPRQEVGERAASPVERGDEERHPDEGAGEEGAEEPERRSRQGRRAAILGGDASKFVHPSVSERLKRKVADQKLAGPRP